MARQPRRVTALEFKALKPFFKLADNRQEAARLILVDGLTYQAAADQMDMTRQNVLKAVNHIWNIYQCFLEAQEVLRKGS